MTIDNETLKQWAGLGPWAKSYNPHQDAIDVYKPVERDANGDMPTPLRIARAYEGQRLEMGQIQLHAECLAAAPTLAAELLNARIKVERLNHALTRMTDIQKRTHKKSKGDL